MTPDIQGPDRDPKPPRFQPPPGATDCHMHVFGPLAEFPYQPDRSYTPPECVLEEYGRMMDVLGLERAVMVQPSVYGFDNRCALEAMARMGVRMRGVAVVPLDVHEGELEQLHAQGVRGVRFNLLRKGGTELAALEKLASRVAELDWHVQVNTSHEALVELAPRLARIATEVVIDHMGNNPAVAGTTAPGMRALIGLLGTGRAWVKLSGAYRLSTEGPPYADVTPLARALIAAAPERCVWASDWPHPLVEGTMPNDGLLLDLLAEWAPDEADRRRVLVDNPTLLYRFGG